MPASVRWRVVLAMSIAGVRGAITLAAVLTLPVKMGNGMPFPGRDLAIFLAAGVIVASLVLATFGLPRALRGLELPTDTSHVADEARARTAGAEAALRAIESARQATTQGAPDADLRTEASTRIAALYRQRIDRYVADDDVAMRTGEAESIERELRLVALRAEREEILRIGHTNAIQEITLRKLVREIDLQEARYSG